MQNATGSASQETAKALLGLGVELAAPFIKSTSARAAEQKAIAEANLVIDAAPVLEQVFHLVESPLASLFHHIQQVHQAHKAHKQAVDAEVEHK